MYTVVWTETAEKSYENNLQYLSEYWSTREIRNFMDKVDEAVMNISLNSLIGSVSEENDNYRKYLVVPQIYLYYRVTSDRIYLVSFWNNFQDPDRLQKLLT